MTARELALKVQEELADDNEAALQYLGKLATKIEQGGIGEGLSAEITRLLELPINVDWEETVGEFMEILLLLVLS